jgi:hypothetical protein
MMQYHSTVGIIYDVYYVAFYLDAWQDITLFFKELVC